MNTKKALGIGCLLAVTMIGLSGSSAAAKAKKPEPAAALTPAGEKLAARYSAMLAALQAEIAKSLPNVSEQKKSALQKARDTTKAAEKGADAAQQSLGKVQPAKALVDHAKGKWIGGAEKGIAQAQASLKKATTDAEREAAKKDLAKWQANKEDGIKALNERQAAWDKVKTDEPRLSQAHKAAQAAMAQARTNELNAVKALLAEVGPFLSSDKLDAKLVKAAVLAEATPRGLAEFAQQDKQNEALVEKLLADDKLMKDMLIVGGANSGKYTLTARVATLQEGQKFAFAANDAKPPVEAAVPYTVGLRQQTRPVELALVKGQNVLHFELRERSRGVTIKDFTLKPVK